jgi:serralysin
LSVRDVIVLADLKMRNHWAFVPSLAVLSSLLWSSVSLAYLSNGRWLTTATDGPTDPAGRPITLTWSIVPDGTLISHLGTSSNLVSVFDSLFSGSSEMPLDEKPWYLLMKQCFDRWSDLSGLTFVPEPADDGIAGHPQGDLSSPGLLGARGDVRLGGAFIDGPSGTFAETGFIPNADITIDTGDTAYYGSAGGTFPYINLRTTLMHEIGHSLGLGHSNPESPAAFLMQGFPQTAFDGPQFDDIRGAHYLYGDVYEKSNAGTGNESLATATPLGLVADGQSVTLGEDATTGTVVLSNETDFVSISNSADVDFFSFSTEGPALVDVVLTPVGPTYRERFPPGAYMNVVSSAMGDLSLELYTSQQGDPVLLSSQNLNPIGQPESILDFRLDEPGTYFVRVTGSADAVQFYTLAIGVAAQPLWGDFNDDGQVDASDYTVWRNNLGASDDSAILNRGDSVAGIDAGDYEIWKTHFGELASLGGFAGGEVPEPSAALGALAASLLISTAGGWRAGGRILSRA